jgi:hypothetical protein
VGWLVCLYDCVMVVDVYKQINKQTNKKHGIIARGGRPKRQSIRLSRGRCVSRACRPYALLGDGSRGFGVVPLHGFSVRSTVFVS